MKPDNSNHAQRKQTADRGLSGLGPVSKCSSVMWSCLIRKEPCILSILVITLHSALSSRGPRQTTYHQNLDLPPVHMFSRQTTRIFASTKQSGDRCIGVSGIRVPSLHHVVQAQAKSLLHQMTEASESLRHHFVLSYTSTIHTQNVARSSISRASGTATVLAALVVE